MVRLSFTNAPLIGDGSWVGLANYVRLLTRHAVPGNRVLHTGYFVLLTVIPTTLLGLGIAMMVTRLHGWLQSLVLACFFLPYILPVTVVTLIWQWVLDLQFGIAPVSDPPVSASRCRCSRTRSGRCRSVAFVTIWWTNGFNVLLFIAGLRNISPGHLRRGGAGRRAAAGRSSATSPGR